MLTRRAFGLTLAASTLARPAPAISQTPLTSEQMFFAEGRYLPQYFDLQAKTAAGDESARSFLTQYAAFLGDEATAIGLYERPRDPALGIPAIEDAVAEDAIGAIVERAADTRVVILNEAHNVSGHRAFAARVARALRPLGFDWFAAETFLPAQGEPAPSIQAYRDGMPFFSSFGYYSNDPVYAETVREAARLGYRFADYENRWNQKSPPDADRDAQIAGREEAQANNLIETVLHPLPEAGVFVFCGYGHAAEVGGPRGEWFAARLKAKSGIDPLTIEQSSNWPATRPENDAIHVAAVLRRFNPSGPIAVSRDGQMLGARSYAGMMDLAVYHPRLDPVGGRPGWLAADPERRRMEVDVPLFEGPALLQALWSGEGSAGVPADQFLLEPGQRRATLFLYPGVYILRLERPTGFDGSYGEIHVKA